ncbi:methylmalonyl-CoA mutase family protein [Myxococcota bacterium]|nr:methylmalonyl-CoA mutase family protein [Myxococcota bacterium]
MTARAPDTAVPGERYRPRRPLRFVTAASLFDGHDASINIFRRLLQASGCEVIHLGHDRAAQDVVDAAVQEDAHGIALSSYQGGHVEYFRYVVELLADRGASNVRVFGGGGGVILPEEVQALEAAGVSRIYSPEDGRSLGLLGIVDDMMRRADHDPVAEELEGRSPALGLVRRGDRYAVTAEVTPRAPLALSRLVTLAEGAVGLPRELDAAWRDWLEAARPPARTPVIGITGTGGAGKSSLTDEIVRRFLLDQPRGHVGILSVDPSKRRTGGALLGDRIRMNSVHHPRVWLRSMATRGAQGELSLATRDAIAILRAAGFDLIVVETSGIGQGDSAIADLADVTLYVMTPEYGAASQLEKIEMLDVADLVVLNKFDRPGSEDALRDVRKQVRRGRNDFATPDEDLPVFGTMASRFDDPGVNALYYALLGEVSKRAAEPLRPTTSWNASRVTPSRGAVIPAERARYLGDIAATVRDYRRRAEEQVSAARRLGQLRAARDEVADVPQAAAALDARIAARAGRLDDRSRGLLTDWAETRAAYRGRDLAYSVRGREVKVDLSTTSLAGLPIPKVALPRFEDDGEVLRFLLLENLPGRFPFTAGLYPFRRQGEDPRRQFAGEGPPERTNRRFHYLSRNDDAKRLSTAFDSVTLYGQDPDERPDIYGKIGESGVSVCTLDDMKKLYAGFDLCSPSTSVSMTINGPAPILLAMFLNTATDQQVDRFRGESGREPTSGELASIRARTLEVVRGTVQADILKEDQAQNTCIFSTEFALKMMGDIQQYFIDHRVRNYYSVSISGYHIAEAGANPISQLAFTLANGFTYVEYYLSRGMDVDAFAPNLSFFFSNGLDAEYTVLGRVARRIWAVALRDRYGASERSQMLKYHIQTSGRSLHAQEIDFNDIRTTLQALIAYHDNCNSLHTNAYDEAITTPTEESVRRAMAIQLVIARELGWAKNENPLQGSFIVDELTDLVEEAVLAEFRRLDDRGGVLGAMERQYQRGKIQDESLHYEELKHSGRLPIVGVNTFLDLEKAGDGTMARPDAVTRATPGEKDGQIAALRDFQERHRGETPAALRRLQQVALSGGNVFAELMGAVRVASLGQITRALFEVGGRYRRSM